MSGIAPWQEVLDFWFPERCDPAVAADVHLQHWTWRIHGGADVAIASRFAKLTTLGAEGELRHWAGTPKGRLALIVVLDQFSRSLWRGTPRAFAQDDAALALSEGGLANGHYHSLSMPWLRIGHTQPLGHCEGPDHLERIDRLVVLREVIAVTAPNHLQPLYRSLVKQARDVRNVIAAFGRHPHRNPILGLQSTAAEQAYLAKGTFPHIRAFLRQAE